MSGAAQSFIYKADTLLKGFSKAEATSFIANFIKN